MHYCVNAYVNKPTRRIICYEGDIYIYMDSRTGNCYESVPIGHAYGEMNVVGEV